MNALTAQENTARGLQQTYQNNQQQTQATEFETKEKAAINTDLTKLQNEDKLPKLLNPDDPKFADDPAVKEIQDVLDFMNKVNNEGLENSNRGGNYYHITFEQAFNMMPKTQEINTRNQRQQQEDVERRQKAGNVGGNTGTENQLNIKKPTVRQGTTLDQIADRIEYEW